MDQASPQTTSSRAPDDRSTTFQAVGGEPEHYSGTTLLVSAYAILWAILVAWIALVWRKQRVLDVRIDDLEREIDKSAAHRHEK